MEAKKNEHAQLGRRRGQFLTIGVIVALSFAILAFEWKSYDQREIIDWKLVHEVESDEIIPPTDHEVIKPPKPPKPIIAPNFEEVKDDDLADSMEDILIDGLEDFDPADFDIPELPVERTVEVFTFVEKMPEYEGGIVAFMKYMGKNIKYPNRAKSLGVEGKVFIQFVIDTDGTITNVELIKGIGAGCDEEAMRVIGESPKWKPGKQRGKPVKVKMVLPVVFELG